MIHEAGLPAAIPETFKLPAWQLTPLADHGPYFLMAKPHPETLLPMPCQHCGGGLSLLGVFPWCETLGMRIWQCLDCLHTSFGNHHIEWLAQDDLNQEAPDHVHHYLHAEQISSVPGHQHCHQNPWLKDWFQDGGFLAEKQPEPHLIQVRGWSSSYFSALDLRAKHKPRSSSLLLQLDGENIDIRFAGLLKYYYCPLSKKTLLDHEPKP